MKIEVPLMAVIDIIKLRKTLCQGGFYLWGKRKMDKLEPALQ